MEARDAVSILPEEVWNLVLWNINDHASLQHVHDTCRLWRKLVADRKTTLLFGGVVQSLFYYLSHNDFINLRVVCKDWSTAVETFLEEEPPIASEPSGSRLNQSCYYNFKDSRDVDFMHLGNLKMEKFIKQFGVNCKKNPFLSRSVTAAVYKNITYALELFELFGEHIWYLQVVISLSRLPKIKSFAALANLIWNILRCVPNLKKLQIYVEPKNFVPKSDCLKIQEVQLRRFLEANPVPILNQLNNIRVSGFWGVLPKSMHLIRNVLISAYAPQLKTYVHKNPENCLSHSFPSLENLFLELEEPFPLEPELLNFSNLKCPRLINLYVFAREQSTLDSISQYSPSSTQLTELVENFKTSLKRLTIFWDRIQGALPHRFDFQFLQELCMEFAQINNPAGFTFYFLTDLPSLRNLNCKFLYNTYKQLCKANLEGNNENIANCSNLEGMENTQLKDEEHERVNLHLFLEEEEAFSNTFVSEASRPFKSNIWRLLKGLEMLEIGIYTYPESPPRRRVRSYIRRKMTTQ